MIATITVTYEIDIPEADDFFDDDEKLDELKNDIQDDWSYYVDNSRSSTSWCEDVMLG